MSDDIQILKGDARKLPLSDESVQCIVTSPPYWGLRKYAGDQGEQPYGLEPTIEAYIATTVEVLRELRRVLRPDGVLFWNIGDSYAANRSYQIVDNKHIDVGNNHGSRVPMGLKPKDLCLIPERVALAAQAGVVEHIVKDEWRGWLAGIIDGEGTIGIHRTVRADGWIQYAPYIAVKMSDAEAIEHIALISGVGRRYLVEAAGTQDKRGINSTRDYHGWRVEGEKAVWILRDIFPFLIVKRRQAKIANALYQMVSEKKAINGNGPVPALDVKKREELWAMCKGCNQRKWNGDVPLPNLEEHRVDQWWVRSRILWCKPNPMPESVTDRPTDAAEHIWMFTKSERYFWDADAVREPSVQPDRVRDDIVGGNRSSILQHSPGGKFTQGFGYTPKGAHSRGSGDGGPKAQERGSYEGWADGTREVLTTRNMRNVWMFATQPYAEAHFATFPEELPRRCILAATSARGACIQCGAPWERVVRAKFHGNWNPGPGSNGPLKVNAQKEDRKGDAFSEDYVPPQTIGWRPTCECRGQHGKTVPCVVLDPFAGSGTVGRVALELQRRAILVDLAYQEEAERRSHNVQMQLAAGHL